METFINTLNGIVWHNSLIYLCLGGGLFFTIVTKGAQMRLIKEMVRLLFDKGDSETGVSSFEAVCMAVSGRVGTGNIAGVATAIALGGPGAIFWLWVISILGGASSFIESTLGQLYKEEVHGGYRGGPSYYFKRGLFGKGHKGYGTAFAGATLLAMGIFLPGVQSNTIATSVNNAFGISPMITGIVIVVVIAAIIVGGAKRIAKFAGVVVPFMAAAYILVAVIILAMNAGDIIPSLQLIVSSAFGGNAALGGMVGAAITWGVKRGIYSNEAGQGTGPASAAAAEVNHPAKQGLVQAFSIYIDSIFVCTATALMIIITGAYKVFDSAGNTIFTGAAASDTMTSSSIGPLNTAAAIDAGIGAGAYIVAISIIFFAFTTILAYFWNGDTALVYFTDGKSKVAELVFKGFFLAFTFYGTMATGGMAWTLGDIGVGLMAWINIVGILMMYKPAVACLKDYELRMKEGRTEENDFDPEALGIMNTSGVWKKKMEKAGTLKEKGKKTEVELA